MKNKITEFMNKRLVPKFAIMATQRHILAIRNGVVQILPFVIAGSIAMIIFAFPIGKGASSTLASKMPPLIKQWIYWLYKWNFSILGLVSAISIGSELAKSYRLNQTTGATLGAASIIMWILPVIVLPDGKTIKAMNIVGSLDATAMLGAIVASIISVEFYRFIVKKNITIKLPKEVPAQVTQAFVAILPIVFVTTLYTAIRHLVGFDIRIFLNITLQPIGKFVSGNIGGVILINMLNSIIWWFGINMSSMLNAMARPFWLKSLEENQAIFEGTKKGSYNLFVEQFNQSFTQAGGSGASLGMVISILIFAKEKGNRTVAWVSLAPGLFNINEPLIFGYPIMLNPYFLVPFVFTPLAIILVNAALAPLFGVRFIAGAPWTLPTPIFALFASGMQWQAMLLAIISIGVSFGVYAPFVIWHDRVKTKVVQKSSILKVASLK